MRRIFRMLVLFFITFTLGCVHLVHKYDPTKISTDNNAKLSFTTQDISKSRWYLLIGHNLQLHIYQKNSMPDGKPIYLGCVELSNEDNCKSVPIPAGTELYIQIRYMGYVVGVMSQCNVRASFIPKAGKSYTIIYSQDDRACKANIKEEENIYWDPCIIM